MEEEYNDMHLDLISQSLLEYQAVNLIEKIIDDNKNLSQKVPFHYFYNCLLPNLEIKE